ncbi:MAG TPA: hypothetical protein PKH33_13495 [bacterium]|nr:hypothetical protein [bacterium]
MSYKNAAEILPEELINEIRKYFPGGILWVPGTGEERKERDELVVFLKKNGVTTKEIAGLAKLTPGQIRRIILKHESR